MDRKFLVLLLFLSCKNKKAELVDLERKYLDSAKHYKEVTYQFVAHDEGKNPKASVDHAMVLERKAAQFQVLADSIEFELKKY